MREKARLTPSGLGLFAAAVAVGNVARLPNAVLNRAASVYLVSRAAYNLLYILGTSSEFAEAP